MKILFLDHDGVILSPYLENFVQVEKATGITAKGVYEQLVEYLNN